MLYNFVPSASALAVAKFFEKAGDLLSAIKNLQEGKGPCKKDVSMCGLDVKRQFSIRDLLPGVGAVIGVCANGDIIIAITKNKGVECDPEHVAAFYGTFAQSQKYDCTLLVPTKSEGYIVSAAKFMSIQELTEEDLMNMQECAAFIDDDDDDMDAIDEMYDELFGVDEDNSELCA